MEPLAAFQVLMLTLAAAMAVEAFKTNGLRRTVYWIIFGATATIGVLTNVIAEAWPAASNFMIWLGSSPVTVFLIAVAVIIALNLSPRRARGEDEGAGSETDPRLAGIVEKHTALIESQIEKRLEIEELVAKHTQAIVEIADDRKAIIRDYQNMSGLEARFSDMLDGLKAGIAAQNKVFEDRHWIEEEALRKFGKEVHRSISQLFLALQAIRARERERFYADIIEEEGEHIQRKVIASERFEGNDWAEWETHADRLTGAMYHWFEIAKGWHPEVKTWINDVPPERLTALDWPDMDGLFQNYNQITHYKTMIVRLGNWQHLRNHVVSAINLAAFGGPDADTMLAQIPGGGPTIEGVKEKADDN